MWRREGNGTRKRRRGCCGRQVYQHALYNYNWEIDNGLRYKDKEKKKQSKRKKEKNKK
jgi:transposase